MLQTAAGMHSQRTPLRRSTHSSTHSIAGGHGAAGCGGLHARGGEWGTLKGGTAPQLYESAADLSTLRQENGKEG